ncbi:MAG: hypothetical protein CSA38_03005 [Flavobacteriales bacterium]|nr:MAG: hypothetical protein CSA38_03005 [Flavobacteriales bacterium]
MRKKSIFKYFVSIYVLSIMMMSLVRLGLLMITKSFPIPSDEMEILPKMFQKGWAFDSLITCYVLVLPIFMVLVYSILSKGYSVKFWRFINGLIIAFFTLVFAILFINIPYFEYNHAVITLSEFGYFKYFKTTLGLVLGEPFYWACIALFFVFVLIFRWAIRFIARKTVLQSSNADDEKKYGVVLAVLGIGLLCGIGMRGTFERYPLKLSHSAFSSNGLYNKMALNPMFYLIKIAEQQSKGYNSLTKIMDEKTAYQKVQQYWNIENDGLGNVKREVRFEEPMIKPNIVIILSESLSMRYLDLKKKDGTPLMPFVKSLTEKSYFFNHFYSAGIHTNNGILATLYGFPPIFNRPSLQNKTDFYTGIPYYLKQNGYANYFFITGNPHYDNMNGFLYESGTFDKIYSLYDYPKEKAVNNFGVKDDFLFEFGIDKLNEFSKNENPFLATFLTVSNHPPYAISEKYKDNQMSEDDQIMMFVDDTLQYFFTTAMEQDWGKNTIFIVLGDHGRVMGQEPYPMALSYNHIPMIMYSPLFKDQPKKCTQLAGQVDVFPTLMGILKMPYTNNSLGIDVFKESREQMFFASNTHLGCINENYFYTYDVENNKDGLFEYKLGKKKNLAQDSIAMMQKLKDYGTSMMRVAEEEIIKKK